MQDARTMLGVSDNFLLNELNKNYRRLALTMHPDKNGNTPEATAAFQKLLDAYNLLKSSDDDDVKSSDDVVTQISKIKYRICLEPICSDKIVEMDIPYTGRQLLVKDVIAELEANHNTRDIHLMFGGMIMIPDDPIDHYYELLPGGVVRAYRKDSYPVIWANYTPIEVEMIKRTDIGLLPQPQAAFKKLLELDIKMPNKESRNAVSIAQNSKPTPYDMKIVASLKYLIDLIKLTTNSEFVRKNYDNIIKCFISTLEQTLYPMHTIEQHGDGAYDPNKLFKFLGFTNMLKSNNRTIVMHDIDEKNYQYCAAQAIFYGLIKNLRTAFPNLSFALSTSLFGSRLKKTTTDKCSHNLPLLRIVSAPTPTSTPTSTPTPTPASAGGHKSRKRCSKPVRKTRSRCKSNARGRRRQSCSLKFKNKH
jgi:hypothetical protein